MNSAASAQQGFFVFSLSALKGKDERMSTNNTTNSRNTQTKVTAGSRLDTKSIAFIAMLGALSAVLMAIILVSMLILNRFTENDEGGSVLI